jgi:hypothetical protein
LIDAEMVALSLAVLARAECVRICRVFVAQPRLSRGRPSGRGSSNEGPPHPAALVGLRRSFVTRSRARLRGPRQ